MPAPGNRNKATKVLPREVKKSGEVKGAVRQKEIRIHLGRGTTRDMNGLKEREAHVQEIPNRLMKVVKSITDKRVRVGDDGIWCKS